jgi:hypothetical protein
MGDLYSINRTDKLCHLLKLIVAPGYCKLELKNRSILSGKTILKEEPNNTQEEEVSQFLGHGDGTYRKRFF